MIFDYNSLDDEIKTKSQSELVKEIRRDIRDVKEIVSLRVSWKVKKGIDEVSVVYKPTKTTTKILVDYAAKGLSELDKRLKPIEIVRKIWVLFKRRMYHAGINDIVRFIDYEIDNESRSIREIFTKDEFGGDRVTFRLPEKIRNGYRDKEESTGIRWTDLLRLKIVTGLILDGYRDKSLESLLDYYYFRIEMYYKRLLDLVCYCVANVRQSDSCLTVLYLLQQDTVKLLNSLREYDYDAYIKLSEAFDITKGVMFDD